MIVEPKQCKTMKEVRAGVDLLDQDLVKMLVIRQEYMAAAARIKEHRAAVHDDARIEDVLKKVLVEANGQGLCSTIAEPVWRKLIECCIKYEFELWDAKHEVSNSKS